MKKLGLEPTNPSAVEPGKDNGPNSIVGTMTRDQFGQFRDGVKPYEDSLLLGRDEFLERPIIMEYPNMMLGLHGLESQGIDVRALSVAYAASRLAMLPNESEHAAQLLRDMQNYLPQGQINQLFRVDEKVKALKDDNVHLDRFEFTKRADIHLEKAMSSAILQGEIEGECIDGLMLALHAYGVGAAKEINAKTDHLVAIEEIFVARS